MTRLALVVGGGSGIGAAAVGILAKEGCVIAAADVDEAAATGIVNQLNSNLHRGYAVDISIENSVTTLFDRVEQDLGPVSVLIITAGISGFVGSKRPTFDETSADNWDRVMAVNARGPFFCVREMLRRRRSTPVEDARIVLTSSGTVHSLRPGQLAPPAYIASKGAVLTLTKAAALEAAGFGMTVNAVSPGAVDTPMLRAVVPVDGPIQPYIANSIAGRLARPDEIAAAIGFLASPAASYINGACLDVNGGVSMR